MYTDINTEDAVLFYKTLIKLLKKDESVLFTPTVDGTSVTVEVINACGQRRKIQAENQSTKNNPFDSLMEVAK